MKCFMCKGHLFEEETTFMVDVGKCIVVVKRVPFQVCAQCGETTYSNAIAVEFERIVDTFRASAAEIAVVNYQDKVA